MKKTINFVLVLFLLLISLVSPVTAQETKIDVETNLSVRNETMLSGERNDLLLGFKVTGPKTVVEDLTMELRYDSVVEIDQAHLDANIPQGFNHRIEEDKVVFTIAEMEAGKFFEIPIVFTAENGIIKNNARLDFELVNLSERYVIENKMKSIIVHSSTPLKINKEYAGLAEPGLENTLGLAPGLKGIWKTKAQVPRSDYGQMYIKEGTKIQIIEEYDANVLEYIKSNNITEPHRPSEGKLVWEFEAPSFMDQANMEDLFYKEFDVIYKVKSDLEVENKLEDQGSKVELRLINIGDENLYDSDIGNTTIYPSAEDTPEVIGNWWIPGHFGPSNAFGDHSTDFEALNTRPTVYEWATLTYAHQIAALDYGEHNIYENYEISYFINDHLVLEEIKTPGRFLYRPNREHGNATYLEEQPILNVSFYDDQDRLLSTFENIDENQIISRKEILKDQAADTHIKKVVYKAVKFVPGMIVDNPEINERTGYTDLPTYTFSIAPTWKKDAVDNMYELKNEKIIEVERKLPIGYKETYDFREGAEFDYIIDQPGYDLEQQWVGWHFLSAPRWAVVTEEEEAYIPTVTNTIDLLEHKDGVITSGPNTLRLQVKNNRVSVGAVLPDVESYFVLPKTIKVNSDSLPEGFTFEVTELDAYNNLYKLQWNNSLFVPREELIVDIKVDIVSDIQSLNLFHYSNLTQNEKFRVLKVEDPVLQDSLKVARPSILDSHLEEEHLVLSRNNYTVLSDYYIKTEKFVKSESDTEFKKSTSMRPDELVTYRLDFINKQGVEIDVFGLIDILPHVGDLGITNFIERGSEFDLVLAKAIDIDDRFEVYYSENKNPSRAILNNLVNRDDYLTINGGDQTEWMVAEEVSSWDDIYSFVVLLKEGEKLAIDEKFSLEFTTQVPNEYKPKDNIYAHNSFALTANGSPLVEPLQVSVNMRLEEEVKTPENPPKKPTVPSKPIIPDEPKKPNLPNKPDVLQPDIPNTSVKDMNNLYFISLIFAVGVLISRVKFKEKKKV